MRRPWTFDEDRVLRWAHRRGIGPCKLCAALGRSYASVFARWRRLGLRVRELAA